MKKIIKKIINKIINFTTNIFVLSNFGRFFLDILNKNIVEKKKIISHKNLKLEFYIPNRLSYFRVKTFSTKEPETLEWIDQFQEKKIFWDVGANIGLYSCYAAKKKQCKVYAFEPSIFNLEWLGRNILLNNLMDKIVVFPVPLFNTISENSLNFSTTEWSGALTTFGQKYSHDGKDFKNVFRYNTLGMSMNDAKNLFNISQPDYIKIDVDGIEHLILRGGEKVLSNTKELLIEINEQFTKQTSESSKLLNDLGFILKEKKRSDLFDKTEFSSSYNQIWVKKT